MLLKLTAFGLIGFGLYLAVFGVIFIAEGFAVRGWDEVTGEVVDVRIRIDTSLQDNDVGWEKKRRYYPEVTYRWTRQGEEYEGDRYRLGTTFEKFKTREEAAEAARSFSSGGEVAVYVDPSNPSSAVLNRRPSATFVPLLIGILFMATGGLIYGFKDQIAAHTTKGQPPAETELTKSDVSPDGWDS
ncbi:MAG: DUF3592 domain-containing protein [Thermoanaerobaculia bacterium]|nr:DUF3592 domain-containing protein [Thermoanaerobaculia bacterium]